MPGKDARGGITNYYQSIRKYFPPYVFYLERGARNWPHHSSDTIELFRLVSDYGSFLFYLIKRKIKLVQTTTSLGRSSLIRDSVYILICKLMHRKIIVFFRGWNPDNEYLLKGKPTLRKIFFSADSLIVLNSEVKGKLESWGYKNNIYLETTLVDIDLLKDIGEDFIKQKFQEDDVINILYLARIEKEKGIFEALDTFTELKRKFNNIHFYIAGDGRAEEAVIKKIQTDNITDITVLGHVSGEKKINAFKNSHIYFFPSYSEGMPNSVLEAMGFGLPIISRNVGALQDILKDGFNGFITYSYEPTDFVALFIRLLSDKKLMYEMSIRNFKYAKERFTSDKVAGRMMNIFNAHFFR